MNRKRAYAVALRVVTAGLVGVVAGIHLDLWAGHGYKHIPTIGALFLLNAVAGSVVAIACLATPRRLVPVTAAASALFAAGTLAALIISVNIGLFGFTETTTAPLFDQAIAAEAATVIAAAMLAVQPRRAPRGSGHSGGSGPVRS